jgi:hypothetical protein
MISQPPPRDSLRKAFLRWAEDVGMEGWRAERYFDVATEVDRWLVDEYGTSLVWATERDLRTHLFRTAAGPERREVATAAVGALWSFLEARGHRVATPGLKLAQGAIRAAGIRPSPPRPPPPSS